ncbi:putative sugar O-methyltransferase, partial [bacterium]|nr:putative sugar O-methyltransferase [bacterium]
FLANFGAWKNYLGISEDSVFIRNSMKSFMKRRYAESGVYYNLLKVWQWFYNDRKPISCLSYPTYGNQAGAYINDVFVGIDSFFSEIYGSLLSGLICDIKHPVVAELGAGHGRLAHFILRNIDDFTFIDYDLPETVCLAAYYLMKVYPDKRTLLYGEEDYSLRRHKEYDLIFMPSYEISKIGECPVDLFLNENSLGEMTKETATNYIAHITGATRGYFFHRNHDTNPIIYSNNECGLLGYEYPIPIDKFNLLFRYPDMHHMLYKGFLDWSLDIFTYLYKRKNSSEPKDTN